MPNNSLSLKPWLEERTFWGSNCFQPFEHCTSPLFRFPLFDCSNGNGALILNVGTKLNCLWFFSFDILILWYHLIIVYLLNLFRPFLCKITICCVFWLVTEWFACCLLLLTYFLCALLSISFKNMKKVCKSKMVIKEVSKGLTYPYGRIDGQINKYRTAEYQIKDGRIEGPKMTIWPKNTSIFGRMVIFIPSVWPSGFLFSVIQFLFIRPLGFGRTDPSPIM